MKWVEFSSYIVPDFHASGFMAELTVRKESQRDITGKGTRQAEATMVS